MPITDSKDSAEKEQNPSPQNFQYRVPFPQQFKDDTIDLYELWITLWNKKWLIIAMTVISALGTVVYALRLPPKPIIYRAEAMLLEPKPINIHSLNVHGVQGVQGVQGVTVAEAFASFRNNLSSRSLQKKFIDEQDLMDILAPNRTQEMRDFEILESFAKMIKIKKNVKGIYVSIQSDDPVFAANLVNDYIRFFDTETIRMLVSARRNAIMSQIKNIEYTIASKREMAKVRRLDRIIVIQEAADTAFRLRIKDRVDTTNIVQYNPLNITTTSTPLYYRGSRALKIEIEVLENRKSDDPFINGLRDLQEKLALLRSIKIEAEGQNSVTIDQAAYPPKKPIHMPKRNIITFLVVPVGVLFLGIFLVLFISFVKRQKEIRSEKT